MFSILFLTSNSNHFRTDGTFENTEALEKNVKPVTTRADSLANTEADFFHTLFELQEETQRDLNEFNAQPRQTQRTMEGVFEFHEETQSEFDEVELSRKITNVFPVFVFGSWSESG